MRRLALIPATLLVACQPPADESAGMFETFPASRVQPAGCLFAAADSASSEDAIFATRQGDPDHMAYARYKGETLKLVPREAPDLTGPTIDVTYDVVDYLKWNIRFQAEQTEGGLYAGTLSLVDTDASIAIQGTCET